MRFRYTKEINVEYIIEDSSEPNTSANELSNKQSSREPAGVWPVTTSSEVEAGNDEPLRRARPDTASSPST